MRRTIGLTAALAFGFLGCARGPAVQAEGLALRRVVIYRNGVAYFERAGHIRTDRVEFKVRGNEVGDFLATLAVIERGGSSVRSASFPIHVADRPKPPVPMPPPPRVPAEDGESTEPKPKPDQPDPNRLETVVLDLDGREHDLQIGYIAETPVWRPSYRLVIDPTGAQLQAWGIVQNLSGEDWRGVQLSLIAGAPLAFEATLGTPVIPQRPTVTDSGEVIAAVPRSETSLSEEPMPAPAPPPAAEAQAMPYAAEEAAPAGGAARSAPGGAKKEDRARASRRPSPAPPAPTSAPKAAGVMRPPMAPFEARQNPSAPRNMSALAGIAVEGGSTRYDIPVPITVPDKSATMVMLLSKRVPGEAVFLFAPDGAVPDSSLHPFRVARFTNRSGGLLERGPIAVFEKGAFLGQGMLDPLPDGATTAIPFALERSMAIDSQRAYSEEGARIARIESGVLTLERDSVTRTRYRVKNGSDKLAKILLKHARQPESRLHNPPKGTEDNVGTRSALVPLEIAAHKTGDLTVDERRSFDRVVDWMSQEAQEAVSLYMADRAADPAIVAQLRSAWDIRAALEKALQEEQRLQSEQSELSRSSEETRRNLRALEKNKAAGDLRQKLTERLARDAQRLDEVSKRLIEVQMKVNEQRVRFSEMVRAIRLLNPPKPA